MTVACVRTGEKYPPVYVEKLRNMVARHLSVPHRFLCLTDRPEDFLEIGTLDVSSHGLTSWWAKMLLFNPAIRRDDYVLYLDLDTILIGSIKPLVQIPTQFSICDNFTRLRGNNNWCQYGSCVMTFRGEWGGDIWRAFQKDRIGIMVRSGNKGDQKAIETLVPNAARLQCMLPKGFLLHYRSMTAKKPPEAKVIIFGGRERPHNCKSWARYDWR